MVMLTLAGCGSPASSTIAPTTGPQESFATATGEATQTLTAAPMQNPIVTITPAGTPTPDLRLPPDQWRKWPVVPVLSPNVLAIYARGMQMGENPRAFSKVGDCQNIREAFLGIYDQPGHYELPDQYGYLQETIDYYSGSFDRDGMAVKGGFTAASVLSPLWADPDFCLAGETPVECEIRVQKPAVMIVSLEVWFKERTAASYESYLRQIVEYAIAHGVVPVLATKADNQEGDNSINLATARLAYEYDIPLWNFWSAVQSMPYHGIDPNRDGFHISVEAWNVRSFTALRTLDAIRRYVAENADATAPGASAPAGTATATPDLSVTRGPVDLSALGDSLTAIGATGRVLFGLAHRSSSAFSKDGVFRMDLDTPALTQILPPGNDFQAASPERDWILVNQDSHLEVRDTTGEFILPVADDFFSLGNQGAFFATADGPVVFLRTADGANRISLFDFTARSSTDLPAGNTAPVELYPSSEATSIWWGGGLCRDLWDCDLNGVFRFDMSTYGVNEAGDVHKPVFDPTGNRYAYSPAPVENQVVLHIAAVDGSTDRTVSVPGDHLVGAAWSPDGDTLAVLTMVRSHYYGKDDAIRVFLLDAETFTLREYDSFTGLNPKVIWSPDGKDLLFTATQAQNDGSYRLAVFLWQPATGQKLDLTGQLPFSGSEYYTVTNIAWLP